MRKLTDLELRVIGECLRAAVEGPFFVWFRKEEEPGNPNADEAWRAQSPRHRVASRERIERMGAGEGWSEFPAIFGFTRQEVAKIAETWQHPCEGTDVEAAANSAMSNLLGYPHRCDHVWNDYFSVTRAELRLIYRNWRSTA